MAAQEGGAERVEICSALTVGGLTPSTSLVFTVDQVKDLMHTHILIRPREGDFVYDDLEVWAMEREIVMMNELKVDGVVLGALTKDGEIDMAVMKRLMKQTKYMDVTFSRAFDEVKDMRLALEQLIYLGVKRVLTSGGAPTAMEGAERIRELVELAGDDIIIMPGGGISSQNIDELERLTGAREFHSTCTHRDRPQPHQSRLFGAAPRQVDLEEVRALIG